MHSVAHDLTTWDRNLVSLISRQCFSVIHTCPVLFRKKSFSVLNPTVADNCTALALRSDGIINLCSSFYKVRHDLNTCIITLVLSIHASHIILCNLDFVPQIAMQYQVNYTLYIIQCLFLYFLRAVKIVASFCTFSGGPYRHVKLCTALVFTGEQR